MTRWQRLKWGWRGFWRAYHRVVVRPALVRVDPFTLLTIVGILGTAWNMGLAMGIRGDADTAVQQLLDAPGQLRNQLDQQLANEQIDPFTYNARMEQIDRLASLFSQYAAIYDQHGDEIFEPAMLNGIRDAALSLAPGEAAGKSVGGVSALQTGKGIDALITLQGTVEGLEGGYQDMYRSWRQNPFADIDRQLQTQIDAIMGADLEPFFAARMRGKVNEMKNIYLDLLRQYPDDPGKAARHYNAILNERAGRYAHVLMLAGEGRHWASVDEFRAWLDGLVQDAVLAEGPEADLFADDSWEDEPDEPPANSEIPDDAFEDDAGSASALPDITVTGDSAFGPLPAAPNLGYLMNDAFYAEYACTGETEHVRFIASGGQFFYAGDDARSFPLPANLTLTMAEQDHDEFAMSSAFVLGSLGLWMPLDGSTYSLPAATDVWATDAESYNRYTALELRPSPDTLTTVGNTLDAIRYEGNYTAEVVNDDRDSTFVDGYYSSIDTTTFRSWYDLRTGLLVKSHFQRQPADCYKEGDYADEECPEPIEMVCTLVATSVPIIER